VSEARSQWAPWVDNTHARELPHRKTREIQEARQRVSKLRSAEAFSSAVKHSVPWSSRTEPKTPWDVHAVKAAE